MNIAHVRGCDSALLPCRRVLLAMLSLLAVEMVRADASAPGGAAAPGVPVYPPPGYLQPDYYAIGDPAHPDLLSETLSSDGDLDNIEQPHYGRFRWPTNLQPWMEFRQGLQEQHGVSIGGSYQLLGQRYSDSLVDEKSAVGSKFTLNLGFAMVNRGRPDALEFDVAIEDRRPLETEFPPLQAGLRTGSIVPTAATWGEFDLGITQAYLRQNLAENRFQWTVGKVFAPNYINAFPFFDDNRQFLSQTFSTSPTIASPLRGFGAVVAAYPFENNNFYIKSGIYTARSDDTGVTMDDFFSEDEHFVHLELGRSALARSGTPIQARGPMDTDNIHIDLWYRDPLEDGSPRAYGAAFNLNFMVNDNLMPFVRGGWSDGWFVDKNLTIGVGWRPFAEFSDLFGFGIGWANPSNNRLQDQYTAEAFYRFHLTPQFAITPNIQLIADPSLNPDTSLLWTGGLRLRIAF